MILEHEIVEQIMDEPRGRPLDWVCRLVRQHGGEPFPRLQRMWQEGYLLLMEEGRALPSWRCEEIWRTRVKDATIRVMASVKGVNWVSG